MEIEDWTVMRAVVRAQIELLEGVKRKVDPTEFLVAVELIEECGKRRGTVVATGMGKSGILARMVAANLRSIGQPAVYINPVEGMHGDVGMVTSFDLVLVISKTGRSENLDFLSRCPREANVLCIAQTMPTGLRVMADKVLWLSDEGNRDGWIPMGWLTMAKAVTDAMVVALAERRGFTQKQYRLLHPA